MWRPQWKGRGLEGVFGKMFSVALSSGSAELEREKWDPEVRPLSYEGR